MPPKPSMKRVRVRVQGVVQGVYYRASTRAKAQALGLTGWVRNTRDGAVELAAQGPDDAIVELLSWLHQGPPAARVTSVDAEEHPVRNDEVGFEIRY